MLLNTIKKIFLAGILIFMAACSKENYETTNPDPESEEKDTVDIGDKEVLIWVASRANIFSNDGRFNDKELISKTLDTIKSVGITGLIVDVKGSSGYVNYQSNIAPILTSMGGNSMPPDMDYLAYMIEEGHKRDLKVYASVNVFVEGDNYRKIGRVFENEKFRNEYQVQVMDASGNRQPITNTSSNAFVNPAHPEVQEYERSIIKEIVANYDIDGMIIDRARYNGITGDFSDVSRDQFIKFLEEKFNDTDAKYMDFPEDIVASWRNRNGSVVPDVTGEYYKRWLLFRAKTTYDFIKETGDEIRQIKPDIKYGNYVGAVYANYDAKGVNWGSQNYDPFNDPNLRFDWAYPGWNEYGHAEELDFLITGNYFTYVYRDEVGTDTNEFHWWSIEGSLNAGKYIVKDQVPLFGSISLGSDWQKKEDIARAMQYVLRNSDGLMIFDLIHAYAPQNNTFKEPLWDVLEEGLRLEE